MSGTALADRFWARVDTLDLDGCWFWTGSRRSHGYGQITLRPARTQLAHRVAYEQAFGPIPPGLLVCHRCDERLCVNPEHLFVGTQKDNIADMISKGRACRGVLHHSVRLTEDQVRQIRVADGTQREIAALFGISQTNVSQIRQRKGWKQLP